MAPLLRPHVRRLLRRLLRPSPLSPPPAPLQEWAIAIYEGDAPHRLAPAPGAHGPVLTRHDVTDVRADFVADPFMVPADGGWQMFFEILDRGRRRGIIGTAASDDGLAWRYGGVVLVEPVHLSYPQVIAWRGEHYMVPESYQAGAVRLYRAERFPHEWRPVATLLEGPVCVDPTLVHHEGRWWLFVDASPMLRHDTLRLYSAPALEGPYEEHPASPLVAGDARIARPAGRIVPVEGRPVRFAQCCTPVYGTSVHALEVTTLTPTAYAERPLGDGPVLQGSGTGWNESGMHHVDAHRLADGRWRACVDGYFWRVG